jgi:hypothetical protein
MFEFGDSDSNDNDNIIDNNKELKDLTTSFIVNEFIKSEESMYNFIKLIVELYNKNINKYILIKRLNENDIFFIYKGGNILRLVSQHYMREINWSASKLLHEFYDKSFKISDSDFSIIINNSIDNYNEVYQDMIELNYLVQNKIRHILISEDYFDISDKYLYYDFNKYSNKYKAYLLNKLLDSVKDMNCLKDENNPTFYNLKPVDIIYNDVTTGTDTNYENKPDFIIKNNNGKTVQYMLNTVNDSTLTVSINDTLEFDTSTNIKNKFALVRTKIMFNYRFKEQNGGMKKFIIGGELIDVSISYNLKLVYGNTRKVKTYSSDINHYQDFKITSKKQSDNFILKSYTLKYLIEDLIIILFSDSMFPWEDPKYIKRINRVIYLYFIDLISKITVITERINLLKNLKQFNTEIRDEFKKLNIQEVKRKLSNLENICTYKNIYISDFISKINSITLTENEYSTVNSTVNSTVYSYDDYKNSYLIMLETIGENIDLLSNVVDIMNENGNCIVGQYVDPNIPETDFSILFGGSTTFR